MAKRRGRRHPGVVLIKPDEKARTGWRVRYRDPDTGRLIKRTIDPALRTRAQREDYAYRLSEQLARRRLELENGAAKATGTPIADAINRYYDAHPNLRPGAVATYSIATNKLVVFARKHRVKTVDDLDRRKLMQFREEIIKEPKRHVVAGRRGAKAAGDSLRSPHSINRELRNVGTALRYLIDCDLFARLTHDDIRRCCKPLKAPVERKDYLRPAKIRRLLEATLRHDAELCALTREEKAQGKSEGNTPRYDPISGFVLFVLLTGMRLGEALDLDWKNVDLGALDANGREVGEIYVTSASKTAKSRTIGLEVSPVLRRLLAAQHLRTGDDRSVWGLTKGAVNAAMRRLVGEYGAPQGTGWQKLRVTCATYLCNAPGIYGSASPFMESRQLGHSVLVAEKHYAGLIRGIPIEAKTLEAAMQIETQAAEVVASASDASKPRFGAVLL